MSLEHKNRRGDRYYVLEGKTKTGKPKYYCAKKPGENTVEQLPPEYEIREDPASALVTVRKRKNSLIAPFERDSLKTILVLNSSARLAIVDVEENCLVVYTPDVDEDAATILIDRALGSRFARNRLDDYSMRGRFQPMLRFQLTDVSERLFSADRWCFLGSIDTWVALAADEPLEVLAKRYVPHLGRESFYELL